ncbi:hypothetical protein ABPG72_014739 [Tetrahymena utriculariae]
MSNQTQLKKSIDNNTCYECNVIKSSSIRPLNNSQYSQNQIIHESACKLKLYSTYIKVIDLNSGIEEVFNLNRKSRIQWIWVNNQFKNNVMNFEGFVLCLSLEPENKQEKDVMNIKMNLRTSQQVNKSENQNATNNKKNNISNNYNNNNNNKQENAGVQEINFSLKSLNQEGLSSSMYDIEKDQNIKIQTICYFTDLESRSHVIQYFKMRVIQRNFHQVYKAVRKLGKGSFASVYLVNLLSTNKHFAIKAFLKEKLIEEEKGYESFYNEIMLMRCVKNKNVLKLIDIWESKNSYYLIMPVCYGGSLLDRIAFTKKLEKNPELLLQSKVSPIDSIFIKSFMKQMLEAVLNLKQQGILHRDLKPDNILLSSPNQVEPLIIDFGLATFQDVETYIYPKCGTPGYVAPEIINMRDKNQRYDSQCDVFSLGAIFYFLLSLKPLFLGKVTKETIELNKKCQIDFDCKELQNLDLNTKDLLKKLLRVNPSERITPEQALQHPYFGDKFEEDDIPDDPETNIDKILQRFNYGRPFDMQKINNHSANSKMNTKIDQSLCSFNYIDYAPYQKKESSLMGASLVMKQPIAIKNPGGRQISLENVVEQVNEFKYKSFQQSMVKSESSMKSKLLYKSPTLEQSEYEFLVESTRIKQQQGQNFNKERSTEDSEKEEYFMKKYSRILNKPPLINSPNFQFKKTNTLNTEPTQYYEDTKILQMTKKQSADYNAK